MNNVQLEECEKVIARLTHIKAAIREDLVPAIYCLTRTILIMWTATLGIWIYNMWG